MANASPIVWVARTDLEDLKQRVQAAESRAQAAECQAAACREAIEAVKPYFVGSYLCQTGKCEKCGDFIPYKSYELCEVCVRAMMDKALASDAGRAVQERIAKLEAVAHAARDLLFEVHWPRGVRGKRAEALAGLGVPK